MFVKRLPFTLLLSCFLFSAAVAGTTPVKIENKLFSTNAKYRGTLVKRLNNSAWFNPLGNRMVNAASPDSIEVFAFEQSYGILINWYASPARPANTDTIIIYPTNNPYWIVFSYQVPGGTGDSLYSPGVFDPGNYTIDYLVDGTTVAYSYTFDVYGS